MLRPEPGEKKEHPGDRAVTNPKEALVPKALLTVVHSVLRKSHGRTQLALPVGLGVSSSPTLPSRDLCSRTLVGARISRDVTESPMLE